MRRGASEWRNRNVKELGYPEIEDFLLAQKNMRTGEPVSDKTRASICSALRDFWG